MTALHQRWRTALRNNDLLTVQAMLAKHRDGLDLEKRSEIDEAEGLHNLSSLDLAARHGHPAIVQALIDAGADVAACGDLKNTALHNAIGRGQTQVLPTLIDAGAPLNAVNSMGYTPLMQAVRSGLVEAVLPLLKAGAEVNRRDNHGQTALHHAMVGVDVDPSIAQALLDAGVDPWGQDRWGDTALHVLCAHPVHYVDPSQPSWLTVLAARAKHEGVVWDKPNQAGHRLLHMAVQSGHVAAMRALLALGISPDQPTDEGVPAIDLAETSGHGEAFRALLLVHLHLERRELRAALPLDEKTTILRTPSARHRL